MQALFYVATFLVSFAVGKAIDDGKTLQQAKEGHTQSTEEVQSSADAQTDSSSESAAWVFSSFGTLEDARCSPGAEPGRSLTKERGIPHGNAGS